MYNRDGPPRVGVEMWVMNMLHYFSTKYILIPSTLQLRQKHGMLAQNGPFKTIYLFIFDLNIILI
jgi:hypothetical protein